MHVVVYTLTNTVARELRTAVDNIRTLDKNPFHTTIYLMHLG
jgi:hypothetical protein